MGSNKLEFRPLVVSISGYFMVSIAYIIMLRSLLFTIDGVNEGRRYLKEAAEDIKDIDDED